MDVVDYIKALIQTEKKFVLPGLGTFTITKKKAKIDAKGKTVSPASTALTFDPKKKADDKILVKHIAKQEKITQAKANEMLKNFIKASEGVLKSGEPLRIPRVGKFKYNDDKVLIFEPDWLLRPKTDYGLKPTKLSTTKKTTTKPASTVKKATTSTSSKPISKTTATKQSTTKPTENSHKPKPISKKEVKPIAQTNNKEATKKKSIVLPIIMAILIVGLLGLFGYQVHKGNFSMDYAKKKFASIFGGKKAEQHIKADSSAAAITEVTDTVSIKDYSEYAFDVEYPEGKFSIIVGSFKKKKYANKLAAKLASEGINANIVQGDNSFYRIIINEANSPDSANELYQTALNIHGEAWVLNTAY